MTSMTLTFMVYLLCAKYHVKYFIYTLLSSKDGFKVVIIAEEVEAQRGYVACPQC
jgi:hypothetical protein